MIAVSAEVASRGAAHHEQYLPPALSRLHEGHWTLMAIRSVYCGNALTSMQVGQKSRYRPTMWDKSLLFSWQIYSRSSVSGDQGIE